MIAFGKFDNLPAARRFLKDEGFLADAFLKWVGDTVVGVFSKTTGRQVGFVTCPPGCYPAAPPPVVRSTSPIVPYTAVRAEYAMNFKRPSRRNRGR